MEYIIKNINDYTDEEVDNFYYSVQDIKKERIDKLVDKKQRKKSIIAEILLNQLLLNNNLYYDEIDFEYTDNGKPYILGSDIHFSIAHSDNYITVVISDKNIGIDIEETKPMNTKMVKSFTTDAEKYYINNSENKDIAFLEIFTLKEAYIKLNDLALADMKTINTVIDNDLSINYCNVESIIDEKYVISIVEEN